MGEYLLPNFAGVWVPPLPPQSSCRTHSHMTLGVSRHTAQLNGCQSTLIRRESEGGRQGGEGGREESGKKMFGHQNLTFTVLLDSSAILPCHVGN